MAQRDLNMKKYDILILGASYGSLLGTKFVLAGHSVKMICRENSAKVFNAEGARIRTPIKGRQEPVEVSSINAPGNLSAGTPNSVNPQDFDLVILAMQEPQYSSPDVRTLIENVALSRVPCLSIMNMPPIPFLKRIPGVDVSSLLDCFKDPSIWQHFDPKKFTLCSPDPQAFRPPSEKINMLEVRLPTNFKAAYFEEVSDNQMLKDLSKDIEDIRFKLPDGNLVELPVKLKIHDTLFVPLAKWAMLLSGNYRCIHKEKIISIKEAVHTNLTETQEIYDWVVELCIKLGAKTSDLVPFDKYSKAAHSLITPSSAARALNSGVTNIERVDKLVVELGKQLGKSNSQINSIVEIVDMWLDKNQKLQISTTEINHISEFKQKARDIISTLPLTSQFQP